MVTVPWWLSGFNVIPQVMEEAHPGVSTRTVGKIMIISILLAGIFYCLVMLSSSMTMPWRNLLDLALPVAGAFEAAFNSALLARVVLLAGLLGLLTTWNAVFIAASRLLFAMGRGRIIAPAFGRAHPVYLTPATAILFVGAAGFLGSFLGRNILVPMVNAGGACIALAFFSTCFAVLRLRQRHPGQSRQFPVPGGVVTVALASLFSFAMMVISVYLPWKGREGGFPVEWGFLLAWGVLGILFWYRAKRSRQGISEAERRRLIVGDKALDLDH
jgi:amino acid transporter